MAALNTVETSAEPAIVGEIDMDEIEYVDVS